MMSRSAYCFMVLLSPALLAGEPPRSDRYGDPLPPCAVARLGTARLRVDQHIEAFAFWPDDRTLAACCWDGSLRFWDRATGLKKRRLQTPLSTLRPTAFIPGKKTVALLSREGELLLWDTATEKTRWRIPLPDYDMVWGLLTASPDGKLLAVAGNAKKVELYETASGRMVRSLDGAEGAPLIFSPDGTLLAIAPHKSPASLWSIRTGKKLRAVPGPESFDSSSPIAFSHDGKMIAVANALRVTVSELATGKILSRIQDNRFDHLIPHGGLLFTPDSQTLIIGRDRGEIDFRDPTTGKRRFVRNTHREQAAWPTLSRDGKFLAVADRKWGNYRFLRLFDPAAGNEVRPPADSHEFAVNFLAFLDGKTLLSCDRETMRTWDAATGEQTRSIRSAFGDGLALSADRKRLAVPSCAHVDLWEIGKGEMLRGLKYRGEDAIRAVAFSPDGKQLISAHNHTAQGLGSGRSNGWDDLHFWDLADRSESPSSIAHVRGLFSQLVIAPDGRTAIVGSEAGEIDRNTNGCFAFTQSHGAGHLYLWDLPTGRLFRALQGHRGTIRCLALSGDGRLLASGSADKTVRLWELASGKTLFTVPADKTDRQMAALSPDGRLLATGDPSAICLWSAASGKIVLELRGHNSDVRCLAFSPDNRRLASGLSDGTALVWDVSSACRAVHPPSRNLTSEELEALWIDLASTDALRAQRAVWTLSAGGSSVVEMLKSRLRPAADAEPKRLAKLISDLDSNEFAVRQSATRELANYGARAKKALDAALNKRPSLEARRRIEELLTRLRRRERTAEQLHQLRAVMVLEQLATDEAQRVLQKLAAGAADACLTQEAKTTLARWSKTEPRP